MIMMSGDWTYILAVALCAASISYTISVTSIFEWLRNLIEDHIGGRTYSLSLLFRSLCSAGNYVHYKRFEIPSYASIRKYNI